MNRKHVILAVLAAVFALHVADAWGETIGLWLMEDLVDTTPAPATGEQDPPGGETLYDQAGNHLDFVADQNFGTVGLDTDVAAVMPVGSTSLRSESGGAGLFNTPAATLLHRGNTGALTVEFWFKSLRITPSIGYVLNFAGGNGGAFTGDWGVYGTNTGELRFFEYSNGLPEVQVSATVSDGGWHHVAFSTDATGVLTSYLDGAMVAQTTATGAAAAPLADVLNFGSMNGSFADHDFLIDELRISDAALVAGAGTGVGELAWNVSLAPVHEPRPADFGRRWVREHDFILGSWGTSSDMNQFVDLGLNMALNNASGYQDAIGAGIESHLLGPFTQFDDQAKSIIDQAAGVPNLTAYLLRDEIRLNEIAAMREVADYIRQTDPNKLIYAGLGSSTPANVDRVIQGIEPDAVIHGFYPYQGPANATDQFIDHLDDVALVRERALHYDLPYFAYLQSFDDLENGPNGINDNRRLPSESELRADMFSKLSGGIKGFVYFVVDAVNGGPLVSNALIERDGDPSVLYQPAKQANAEAANLGASLRFLESTDWRFVPGGISDLPIYVDPWAPLAGNGRIVSVTLDDPPADRADAMVGYFTDDTGGDYFMLVNLYHGQGMSADNAARDFTLVFDPTVETLWRLDRVTGEVDQIDLIANTLNLTLPGGTGDLFKFDDGNFPGLVDALIGDYDGSGLVGQGDLALVLQFWGQTVTSGQAPSGADLWVNTLDVTGPIVGQDELALVLQHWGDIDAISAELSNITSTTGLSEDQVLALIPEPASVAPLIFGGLMIGRCR